jgi:hypothetical protein
MHRIYLVITFVAVTGLVLGALVALETMLSR